MPQPLEQSFDQMARHLSAYREAVGASNYRQAMDALHQLVRLATTSYEQCDRISRARS